MKNTIDNNPSVKYLQRFMFLCNQDRQHRKMDNKLGWYSHRVNTSILSKYWDAREIYKLFSPETPEAKLLIEYVIGLRKSI